MLLLMKLSRDLAPVGQHLDQLAVLVGLEVLEGEVLELPLDLPHPEPMGQRGVDLHRLARDARLLLRRQEPEGAHVVEPVGELDDHHPHVLGHGQEHLADVLGLLLLHGSGRSELGELGDPVDQARRPRARSACRGPGSSSRCPPERRAAARRPGSRRPSAAWPGSRRPPPDAGCTARRDARSWPSWAAPRPVGTLDQADVDARPMATRLVDDVGDGMGRLRRRLRARDALHHGGRGRPQAGQVHVTMVTARSEDAGLRGV